MRKLNNYRTITARLPQTVKRKMSRYNLEQGLGVFVTIFMVSFTATLGWLLYTTYGDYREEMAMQQEVKEKLLYWESVIAQRPNFPAAYYEAAVYAARLSDKEKAKEFIEKALFVDPNFFEATVLARELKL